MNFTKGILLGSGAALFAVAGAQAADLPSRKSAPVEYVKVCSAYGAGFFFIPGTDTCLRIGGYVRIEYDNRQNQTTNTTDTSAVSSSNGSHPGATSGWYTRGVISTDARTATPYGTVQAYIQARAVQSGSGTMHQDTHGSIEAAYIRFAGFTFGQARQPYAFMSSWGYMSNWWTGWPNGVRQISYTQVLGGGLSVTASVQDGNSNASGMGINDNAIAQSWDQNGPVYIGAVNYDQSWGRLQAMGAYTNNQPVLASRGSDGYAVGMGAAFNLPMLGKGDTIEFTANYWDGLAKLGVGNTNLSTPSSGSWGPVSPLRSLPITTSSGWSVGAQLQHYWTPQWRTVVFGAYADMDLNGTTAATAAETAKAISTGAQLVWSPVSQFDIGLQALYLRTERKSPGTVANNYKDDNIGMKLRVERRF